MTKEAERLFGRSLESKLRPLVCVLEGQHGEECRCLLLSRKSDYYSVKSHFYEGGKSSGRGQPAYRRAQPESSIGAEIKERLRISDTRMFVSHLSP